MLLSTDVIDIAQAFCEVQALLLGQALCEGGYGVLLARLAVVSAIKPTSIAAEPCAEPCAEQRHSARACRHVRMQHMQPCSCWCVTEGALIFPLFKVCRPYPFPP